MNSFYRHLLKQAFVLTWHNKWLWVFGLFALILGNGGVFNMIINNVRSIERQGELLTDIQLSVAQSGIGSIFRSLAEIFSNIDAQSALFITFILFVSLLLLWVSIVALGGLTSGIFRVARKQIGNSWWANIKENALRGFTKFWPVLGVNIGGRLLVVGLLLLLSLPFFFLYISTQNLLWQWVILIISFMILIPVAAVVAFLIIYATIYVVIKNSGVKMAVKESWALFKKNWIVSLETAFVLLVVNALYGIAFIVCVSFLLVPFFILIGIAIYFQLNSLLWFAVSLGIIVFLFSAFAAGAMWATYQTTVWILLFSNINDGVVLPKILRLAAKVMSWFDKKGKSPKTP